MIVEVQGGGFCLPTLCKERKGWVTRRFVAGSSKAKARVLRELFNADAVVSSEVLANRGGLWPWVFEANVAIEIVRPPRGETHSMIGESGQRLGIGGFASDGVIDEHPRTRSRRMGKGHLGKLGYKVEVVSDLPQSRVESAVVQLIPANSVQHRHVAEAQLLAGK